jgi:hypothetical protein
MLRRTSSYALLAVAIAVSLNRLVFAEEPETVMITLRARAGAERALTAVLARHYDVAHRLNLLAPDAPHVTLRALDEGGKPYFVEILTWRDGEVPDHAPSEIQAIWREMNGLVEQRSGKPGLDIVPMTAVTEK